MITTNNTDILNGKRLLDFNEFCLYTGLGRTKGGAWAKEIGAIRHIGRRVLFDRAVIDKAIDDMGRQSQEPEESIGSQASGE